MIAELKRLLAGSLGCGNCSRRVVGEGFCIGEEFVVEPCAMCFMLEALAAAPDLQLDPDCF